MTVILTILVCKHFLCMIVYVPTPFEYTCNDPSFYEELLKKDYPSWSYSGYNCDMNGRYV